MKIRIRIINIVVLISVLLSSCYITRVASDKESFIKTKIDLKQKLREGKITQCEYDWLMLTHYEMYYGQ